KFAAQIYADGPAFVSDPAMRGLFGTDAKWGADTYLLDTDGSVLLPSQREGGPLTSSMALILSDEIQSLLAGQDLALLRRSSGTRPDMLIVATPVLVNENVVGFVCMVKPLSDVVAALSSLLSTLWISSLLSLALLIPMAGLAAWHLTRPLHRMRERALRMANGDLRVRVDIQGRGEIGELAGALNKLAERLGSTISALMLERNRALRILNALDEGIMAVDIEGEIIQINPSLHALLQLRPGDKMPDPISSAFYAAIRDNKVQSLQLPHQDIILEISILPLSDQGRVTGAVGVFRDGTQAWRLEQTRRDYVANVSHELRSPLTALRCLIEPLYDGMVQGEEKKRELYGVLLRETMRLSRLVDDMLELSRLQSGTIALEKQD
nr:HAMP domain-containing protein [Clostridia bacterium]